IIGRYILTPEIFGCIERTKRGSGGEIQLTDAIRELLKEQEVFAFEFEGDRYDAGDKLGFIKANVSLALQRDGMGEDLRAFLSSLDL
ncbi:MAG: UTP--glucose-1-phosphate uridylyltransferase, partial [Deltaproteobacteria bacterium]|nr:UTP--glucose-1-phosphate uridylyltransferase [Deltaproteobacteria bacterium]